MKFISFLILALTFTNVVYGHSLEEAISMVRLGSVDKKEMIIKFNNKAESLFSFWRFEGNNSHLTRNLFTTKDDNNIFKSKSEEVLQNYSQVFFKREMSDNNAVKALENIYSQHNVEFAFFAPIIMEAVLPTENSTTVTSGETNLVTLDFEKLQFYLDPAPRGVDARFAWNIPGGTGKGVKIIDIETGVQAKHNDFNEFFFISKLPHGTSNHGTAVAGVMVAKSDGVGVTGVSYGASYGFYSRYVNDRFFDRDYHFNVAQNIEAAINHLGKGDIIVLEMHSPGPGGDYIPVEFWQPIFDIVKVATERGIHCVAAGGNGSENLDDEIYNRAFDVSYRDSGCVLVGAVESEGDLNQKVADFSNYGERIDTFGYGRNVVSTGYGDLYFGDEFTSYTDRFSGTSSATPIVGGVMADLLGIAKERGVELSPERLREALRSTGTPQRGDLSKQIGNLPNLVQLIDFLF